MLIITVLDYILPIYGSKKYGVSKYGIWGSVIGMLIGILFFPPVGMIIGLFLGAFLGELIIGKSELEALKGGFITFIFSLIAIFIKVALSIVFTFYFILYWT
jgi:uncharacterized protein YqgC (DUF456 family)